MATARTICTRALRRLGVIDALATPSAEDAVLALDALNEMRSAWRTRGVDCLPEILTLDSEAAMFVPPGALKASAIAAVVLKGTWDASTNSPALASSSGTMGDVYRVAVAGSTSLDEVASWNANDYAVYSGSVWLKGKSYDRHDAATTALLARNLTQYFRMEPPEQVIRDAQAGWAAMLSDYIKPPDAAFDSGLLITSANRFL